MHTPKISLVAGIGENRELGKDNKLLWDIPEDMKHFRNVTRGHPIIMGRKTYESIGGPLPGRTNIVVTRNKDYEAPGCVVVGSIEEAIEEGKKHDNEEICIIGGAEIYKLAMDMADTIHLTIVRESFDADTFFPEYGQFSKVVSKRESSDENYTYTFLELERG